MQTSPETRPSLLLRLRNLQDEQAWREFLELYEPLSSVWRDGEGCSMPTLVSWFRKFSSPWRERLNASIPINPRGHFVAGWRRSRET